MPNTFIAAAGEATPAAAPSRPVMMLDEDRITVDIPRAGWVRLTFWSADADVDLRIELPHRTAAGTLDYSADRVQA